MPFIQRAGDIFNRSDNTDLGTLWDGQTGESTLQIVSQKLRHSAVGSASVGVENYNGTDLWTDQWAAIVIATFTGAQDIRAGVILRASASAQTYYYFGALKNNAITSELYKIVAGVQGNLGNENATTWAANDVLRLEVEGNQVRGYRNNAVLLSATDTAIASGRAGAAMYVGSGGSLANCEVARWSAGDLISTRQEWLFPKPILQNPLLQGRVI